MPNRFFGCALATALLVGLASAPAAAAVIGYHDASDPVKTIGWACSTDGADAVRVRLSVDTPAGPVLLASMPANERRDDLAFVCPGGSAHAFRFADYAMTADGIALLERSEPAALRVEVETPNGFVALPGTPRAVSFAATGFRDADVRRGRWRTDHDDPAEGTAAAPLLLGECAFSVPTSDGYPAFSGGGNDPATGCRYGRLVTRRSNAATSEAAWPRDDYWVVVANREDAFDNPFCVDGPPGQSLPIGPPGTGNLFGLIALPDFEGGDPARRKLHLVLNSLRDGACRDFGYGIPYLSIGAQADRGNDGVLTYLNAPAARHMLRFGLTLMDIADRRPDAFVQPASDEQRYSQAHLLIEAMWGGRKRWIFVGLMPDIRHDANGEVPVVDAHFRFNWHLVNSFIYPGADYVFKAAAALSGQCASQGLSVPVVDRGATYTDPSTRARSRTDYAIDLQKLFDCLARTGAWGPEPMPAHRIPVTGVHFGIEQDDRFYRAGAATGQRAPNAIWIAIDGVGLD